MLFSEHLFGNQPVPLMFGAPALKRKRNCSVEENMNKRKDYVAFYKIVGGIV